MTSSVRASPDAAAASRTGAPSPVLLGLAGLVGFAALFEVLPRTGIVKPEYFDTGYRLLELDADNDAAWHNVWNAFNAGGS